MIIYTVEFRNDDDSQDSIEAFGSLSAAKKYFRERIKQSADDPNAELWLSRWTLKHHPTKKMFIGMMSNMGHPSLRNARRFARKEEVLEVYGISGRYVGEVWRA
tara:strand:+ start:2546 stop:2857 length:312 start_codon:yes stop_codon:yes gene_type:complete